MLKLDVYMQLSFTLSLLRKTYNIYIMLRLKRPPVAPKGCPIDTEPPQLLSFSMGTVPT